MSKLKIGKITCISDTIPQSNWWVRCQPNDEKNPAESGNEWPVVHIQCAWKNGEAGVTDNAFLFCYRP